MRPLEHGIATWQVHAAVGAAHHVLWRCDGRTLGVALPRRRRTALRAPHRVDHGQHSERRQAHAQRQGIPYENREQLLERLPERLRALADHVLSGQAKTGEVAYAVAALIDSVENAPTRDRRLH